MLLDIAITVFDWMSHSPITKMSSRLDRPSSSRRHEEDRKPRHHLRTTVSDWMSHSPIPTQRIIKAASTLPHPQQKHLHKTMMIDLGVRSFRVFSCGLFLVCNSYEGFFTPQQKHLHKTMMIRRLFFQGFSSGLFLV